MVHLIGTIIGECLFDTVQHARRVSKMRRVIRKERLRRVYRGLSTQH